MPMSEAEEPLVVSNTGHEVANRFAVLDEHTKKDVAISTRPIIASVRVLEEISVTMIAL